VCYSALHTWDTTHSHAQHACLIHESSIYDTLTCAAYTYTDVRTLTRMSCTRVMYIRHTVMRDLRDTHVLQTSHLHTTLSHAQPTPTLTCTTYTYTDMRDTHVLHTSHPRTTHWHAQHARRACCAHESSQYDPPTEETTLEMFGSLLSLDNHTLLCFFFLF